MNSLLGRRRPFLAARRRLVLLIIMAVWLAGCANPLDSGLATPLPAEYIPTAAALTLAARRSGTAAGAAATSQPPAVLAEAPSTSSVDPPPPAVLPPPATLTETAAPSEPPTPSQTATLVPSDTLPAPTETRLDPTETASAAPSATATVAASMTAPPATDPALSTPSPTISLATAIPTATSQASPTTAPALAGATPIAKTPAPPLPEARIQIYQLGERSKVVSPLDLTTRLTTSKGLVVRIELHGEDGRVLARFVRTYSEPWDINKIFKRLDFEINGASELGRLVISVEDQFKRLIEVNSVDLILLSVGKNELNPASTLWQRIIIHEPQPKALIQGGTLIVTGRAMPYGTQPLKVMLVGEDGRVLGQRLAGVTTNYPDDYGTFVTEVPYQVSDVTPALLVIYEDGGQLSPIDLLTSIPVTLSP